MTGHVSSPQDLKKIIKSEIAISMITVKKSLCYPANKNPLSSGRVLHWQWRLWSSFVGILHVGGLFMPSFFGEGRRGGGAAPGREQATNTHSGTFHNPDATSGEH